MLAERTVAKGCHVAGSLGISGAYVRGGVRRWLAFPFGCVACITHQSSPPLLSAASFAISSSVNVRLLIMVKSLLLLFGQATHSQWLTLRVSFILNGHE